MNPIAVGAVGVESFKVHKMVEMELYSFKSFIFFNPRSYERDHNELANVCKFLVVIEDNPEEDVLLTIGRVVDYALQQGKKVIAFIPNEKDYNIRVRWVKDILLLRGIKVYNDLAKVVEDLKG